MYNLPECSASRFVASIPTLFLNETLCPQVRQQPPESSSPNSPTVWHALPSEAAAWEPPAADRTSLDEVHAQAHMRRICHRPSASPARDLSEDSERDTDRLAAPSFLHTSADLFDRSSHLSAHLSDGVPVRQGSAASVPSLQHGEDSGSVSAHDGASQGAAGDSLRRASAPYMASPTLAAGRPPRPARPLMRGSGPGAVVGSGGVAVQPHTQRRSGSPSSMGRTIHTHGLTTGPSDAQRDGSTYGSDALSTRAGSAGSAELPVATSPLSPSSLVATTSADLPPLHASLTAAHRRNNQGCVQVPQAMMPSSAEDDARQRSGTLDGNGAHSGSIRSLPRAQSAGLSGETEDAEAARVPAAPLATPPLSQQSQPQQAQRQRAPPLPQPPPTLDSHAVPLGSPQLSSESGASLEPASVKSRSDQPGRRQTSSAGAAPHRGTLANSQDELTAQHNAPHASYKASLKARGASRAQPTEDYTRPADAPAHRAVNGGGPGGDSAQVSASQQDYSATLALDDVPLLGAAPDSATVPVSAHSDVTAVTPLHSVATSATSILSPPMMSQQRKQQPPPRRPQTPQRPWAPQQSAFNSLANPPPSLNASSNRDVAHTSTGDSLPGAVAPVATPAVSTGAPASTGAIPSLSASARSAAQNGAHHLLGWQRPPASDGAGSHSARMSASSGARPLDTSLRHKASVVPVSFKSNGALAPHTLPHIAHVAASIFTSLLQPQASSLLLLMLRPHAVMCGGGASLQPTQTTQRHLQAARRAVALAAPLATAHPQTRCLWPLSTTVAWAWSYCPAAALASSRLPRIPLCSISSIDSSSHC